MTAHPVPYQPISCDFHDLLEVHATARQPVQIRYRNDTGTEIAVSAIITDVFARAGADYLSLSSGQSVRLDRLVDVDGVRLADYRAA